MFSADTSGPVVVIETRTRSRVPAGGSGCGVLIDWAHGRYVRHLADAALGGRPVRIDLSVRCLYGENPSCPKVTFAEQMPGLTVRCQRGTPLLQHLVESVGCCAGGPGRGPDAAGPERQALAVHRARPADAGAAAAAGHTPGAGGWMTSRSTATPTAPFWSRPPPASRSRSGRAGTPNSSAGSSARIPESRSPAATTHSHTGRAEPTAPRRRPGQRPFSPVAGHVPARSGSRRRHRGCLPADHFPASEPAGPEGLLREVGVCSAPVVDGLRPDTRGQGRLPEHTMGGEVLVEGGPMRFGGGAGGFWGAAGGVVAWSMEAVKPGLASL